MRKSVATLTVALALGGCIGGVNLASVQRIVWNG
jgi:hypothetical protein